MTNRTFHIHGDNIVECERFLELVSIILEKRGFLRKDLKSSFICPQYLFEKDAISFRFQFLPGIKTVSESDTNNRRWNNNILDVVKKRGGPLREAADILLTEVIDSEEKPIVAIEYCSALPAGNQAWQRSGRSYSYGKAKIPILYVVDIGGYELSGDRERKSPRLPSSAVPFSYICFSTLNRIQVSQIFMCNFGTNDSIRTKFGNVFGDQSLLNYVEGIIFNNISSHTVNEIRNKQLQFILNTSKENDNKKFNTEQWSRFFDVLNNEGNILEFLENEGIKNWLKKVSIDTTQSFKQHLDLAKELCLGITQQDLPFCLLPGHRRQEYLEKISNIYNDKLNKEFYQWISSSNDPLVLCWIAGFKPRGDDSRPDRGLIPLCRMLLGEDVDILTIVYGPAPMSALNSLDTEPSKLQGNGLWQAILDGSTGLIVDSKTSESLKNISFLENHWKSLLAFEELLRIEDIVSPYTDPYPLNFSENDVDSLIHNFFKKYQEYDICFEASCNPPGGDWSGISYFNKTDSLEYRWLTLPRVSEDEAKRPDHVIQIFDKDKIYILSIESKNWPQNIETNIGPRLSKYVQSLFNLNCNASRKHKDISWSDSVFNINNSNIIYASGIAFLGKTTKKNNKTLTEKIIEAERKSNSDITFIVNLIEGKEILELKSLTPVGQKILTILESNSNIFEKTQLELDFSYG